MDEVERTLDDLLEEDHRMDAEAVMRELELEAIFDDPPPFEDNDESLKL